MKLKLQHRREGRLLHLWTWVNSSVEYENWEISEISSGSEIILIVEQYKKWKSPYSHTVNESSIGWWEPEFWLAPNSAGYIETIDLNERISISDTGYEPTCQVTISIVVLHLLETLLITLIEPLVLDWSPSYWISLFLVEEKYNFLPGRERRCCHLIPDCDP